MNFQNIIAAIIIFGAVAYVAMLVYWKTRSISPKSGCASECGCGSKSDDAKHTH
ncbi:MAG: FeoB-associated Cys-rich membrane protein [Pyrinomonadaceae bacterium]